MIKEFNLSEKLYKMYQTKQLSSFQYQAILIHEKEFIKRLKENLGNDCTDCNNWNIRFIDKLAGDKLI